MSITNRISELERRLWGSKDNPLEAVPESWMEPDCDGRPIGPLHGEHVTEGQRRTWETMQAMNEATVPWE